MRIGPSNFDDVGEFHQKFGLPAVGRTHPINPTLLDDETYRFRLKFMAEELEEFVTANLEGNLEKAADALIDLVYVVMGTAHKMGLPWQELWSEVHRANLGKERATSSDQSKRGSQLDVIKPPGWQPPEIARILGRYRRAD